MKKLLSFVLSICLILPCMFIISGCKKKEASIEEPKLDVWDGTIVEVSLAQNGVIEIDSAEELAGLAKSVNKGDSYQDITIKLTTNIDLNNREWTPIGFGSSGGGENIFMDGNSVPFDGIFDGDNHTIYNLKVSQFVGGGIQNNSASGIGLFGHILHAEIKNVNSFSALQRAIEYEIDRQIEIVEEGGEVVQETRLWDDNSRETRSMRGKEDAHDYRYFPEPDLMPLKISREWVQEIKDKMPELPQAKRERYMSLGLSEYDASVIVEQMGLALFFDEVLKLGASPKVAVNFIMGEITAYLKEEKLEITDTKLTPENLVELIALIEKNTISNNIGKQIIIDMMKDGTKASKIVEDRGLSQISDTSAIKDVAQKVVEAHPNEVSAYKNGKVQLLGFFVGQVMKETKGRANPKAVNEILKEILG